jgi:hypothetical protein
MNRTGRPLGSVESARRMVLVALTLVAGGAVTAQATRAQESLSDRAFVEIRRAATEWDRRGGPERQVVDVVCLVPDATTFLEAIAAWDERHYFPILIDDVEYSLKFLRAFHPARVVRLPRTGAAVSPAAGRPQASDEVWRDAVSAVGRSWTADDRGKPLPGDAIPRSLGPTPPGVVVSAPDSPALAGAVALAAGRFQPLVRWRTARTFNDELKGEEAEALARELEGIINGVAPDHGRLGDDCDFVTLAGDYPYRYLEKDQRNAFDDLILRGGDDRRRWAYAGRVMGGPTASVYRAMCGLFLTPATGIAYNTYAEVDRPWSDYVMTLAAARLNQAFPTQHLHGDRANLAGWHETFDPVNRQGLALINTHGGATNFHLAGGVDGHTSDIPESAPTAVLIIHSFSAESPTNAQTLAGRWLANGAFVYFGAMYEPYLQSFRTPSLVSTFLAENLPVVAAVRMTQPEPFAKPWRLVYFGDPLWRIKPAPAAERRMATWNPVATWPAYGEYVQPDAGSLDDVRLTWALKMAIFRLQLGAVPRQRLDLPGALLGIARERLDPKLKPIYDDLLVDTLLATNRVGELLDRLSRVPPAERTADIRRHLETAQTAALERARAANDFRQATALWSDVARASGSRDFVRVFTDRVALLADTPAEQADWRDRLRAARQAAVEPSNAPVIEAELKRVEDLLAKARSAAR